MKKIISALLVLCLLPMTFFVSCGNIGSGDTGEGDKTEVDFSRPVYGECEKISFAYTDEQSGLEFLKSTTDPEEIAEILSYVNGAELTLAEELYTGDDIKDFTLQVYFHEKDGKRRSFGLFGENTIYTDKNVPFYTDENFEKDLRDLCNAIRLVPMDAEK